MAVKRYKINARVLGLLALSFSLLSLSCMSIDFEEVWEIKKLRLLAVTVEPPEIGPGETAQVQGFAASDDISATFSWVWKLCVGPVMAPDDFECMSTGDDELDAMLAAASGSLSGGAFSLPNPLSAAQTSDLCDAMERMTGRPCALGLPVTLLGRVSTDEGDERVTFSRQVTLLTEDNSDREDRNSNPLIGGTILPEAEATADAPKRLRLPELGEWIVLEWDLNEDSAQRYRHLISDELEREELDMSWFVSGGELERSASYYKEGVTDGVTELATNKWRRTAERDLADGDILRVWVVLRDSRGGTAVGQDSFLLYE